MALLLVPAPDLSSLSTGAATLQLLEPLGFSSDGRLLVVRATFSDAADGGGILHSGVWIYDLVAKSYLRNLGVEWRLVTKLATEVVDARLVGNFSDYQILARVSSAGAEPDDRLAMFDRSGLFDVDVLATLLGPGLSPRIERLAVSADGRFLVVQTDDASLAPDGRLDTNDLSDIYLLDRATKVVTRVSEVAGAEVQGFVQIGGVYQRGGILEIAFVSPSAFVKTDKNGSAINEAERIDAYLWSSAYNAAGLIGQPTFNLLSRKPDGSATGKVDPERALIATGAGVFFTSTASDLIADDRNDAPDVFLAPSSSAPILRVSLSGKGELSVGAALLDADLGGRRVVIITSDPSLGVSQGVDQAVIVDRDTTGTWRIGSASGDGVAAEDIVIAAAVSPTADLIAFTSAATNLGPIDSGALQGSLFLAGENRPPSGSVVISGSALRGQVLQVSQSIVDPEGIPYDGVGAVVYQWLADSQPIAGANGLNLSLGAELVGKAITVRASYIDNSGTSESLTSAPTAPVVDSVAPARNGRTKYFVARNEAGNFTDLSLHNDAMSLRSETIEFIGSDKVDSVFVRPGVVLDFSFSGASADKIYLSGTFASYIASVAGTTLTIKRGSGSTLEQVTVNVVNSESASDRLIFSDGSLSALAIATKIAAPSSVALVPSAAETSLSPAAPAATGSTLGATLKAFALYSGGDVFTSVKPGVELFAFGNTGVDKVFVAAGTVVDATGLGADRDQIFFTGAWRDYQKTLPLSPSGNTLVFSRQVGSNIERVEVSAQEGALNDMLIFRDGAVLSLNALNALRQSVNVELTGVANFDASLITPQ